MQTFISTFLVVSQIVLRKPWRNSVTTNIGTYRNLSSIWDWTFGKTIYRLKVYLQSFLRNSGAKFYFILLKVLRLNPSPLHMKLTFLTLFSTFIITTSIVSLVLTVLLLPDLSSLSHFFTFFCVALFVGGFFSGHLLQKASFTTRKLMVLYYVLTTKTSCSVINSIFNIETLFFVSFF